MSKGLASENTPSSPRAADRTICPVETAARILSGKWRLLILRALVFHQQARYNELLREIPDISPKELTRNLRVMKDLGLVTRQGTSRDQRVVYQITTKGADLGPIFEQLGTWSERHPMDVDESEEIGQ